MKRRILSVLVLTLLGASFLGLGVATAHASHRLVVNIEGFVTADGETLPVGAHASGSVSLSGIGFDVPPGVGMCLIRITSGSISGNVVTLSGPVVFLNDPTLLVVDSVTWVANASTGHITWTFDDNGRLGGPFVFEGTGSIVIAHR